MADANATQATAQATEQTVESPGILDQMIRDGMNVKDEEQEKDALKMIDLVLNQVLDKVNVVSKDIEIMINTRIGQLDKIITEQLNKIMHAPDFQKLEASWRGLHYLVHQSETGEMLKIRVLNAGKKELQKDMEKAVEFDQSALFKKIYEEEYGVLGGSPFGAMIGDYEFGALTQDIGLLEKLSNVAAAAHAPFIGAANSGLFGLNTFTDLDKPRDIAKIFDSRTDSKYIKWRSFRDSDDSRYVGLVMPHILLREPYGSNTVPTESFNFEEDVDGKDHGKYLWGNAVYAYGTRLTDAFAKFGWCAAIRGVEGGGLVDGLPTHSFRTDEGDVALKCPTEIAITDRREKELSDLGFIPLIHSKGSDYAAFIGGQSVNKPKKYDLTSANDNARLSAQLPYIFATSRFAHYLKSMMRDKVGSFMSRKNCEDYLNRWISQYVLLDDNAGPEAKARKPLREARIDVVDIPGKPGAYKAVAFLRPHYQLEELTISLRLVAELPQPAK